MTISRQSVCRACGTDCRSLSECLDEIVKGIRAGRIPPVSEETTSERELLEALAVLLYETDRRFPRGQSKQLPGMDLYMAMENARRLVADNSIFCGHRIFLCQDGGSIFCTQPKDHDGECRGVWREDPSRQGQNEA